MNKYRYQLRSTGQSSSRYGTCEVCGEYCPDVFIQIEEVQYSLLPEEKNVIPEEFAWTHFGCHTLFGHKECLESKQR